MRFLFAIGPAGVLFIREPARAQAKDSPLRTPTTPTGTLEDGAGEIKFVHSRVVTAEQKDMRPAVIQVKRQTR